MPAVAYSALVATLAAAIGSPTAVANDHGSAVSASQAFRGLRPELRNPRWAQADDPPLHRRDDDPLLKPVAEKVETKKAVVEGQRPLYKTWWFWLALAAVGGGTAALGAATIETSITPARSCPRGTLVCFGDGRGQ